MPLYRPTARLLQGMELQGLAGRPPLVPSTNGANTASGRAMFLFLGRTSSPKLIQRLAFNVNTAGVGAEVAEAGIFTAGLPNGGSLTLTCVDFASIANGTLPSLLSTGIKRTNAGAFTHTQPTNTGLWAGWRVGTYGTSQPQLMAAAGDLDQGNALFVAGAAAFALGNQYTAAVTGITGTGANVPFLLPQDF
jgi:hypothetical protein